MHHSDPLAGLLTPFRYGTGPCELNPPINFPVFIIARFPEFAILILQIFLRQGHSQRVSDGPFFSLAREKNGEKRVLGGRGVHAAVRFMRKTNLIASSFAPGHLMSASVRAAR